MPISRDRFVTAKATMPYTPIAARSSPTPPRMPSRCRPGPWNQPLQLEALAHVAELENRPTGDERPDFALDGRPHERRIAAGANAERE